MHASLYGPCRWLGFVKLKIQAFNRSLSSTATNAVVGILGATGAGKTKLSIDIGTRLLSEIINTDKMQVYHGLDITTNKIPIEDRRGVPHHLLGQVDPSAGQLTPEGFRSLASARITSILSRGKVPIIAGGSNSFVHALLSSRSIFDGYPFEISAPKGGDRKMEEKGGRRSLLRYRSCLLWVDVDGEVLDKYLDKRVDDMIEMGMVEELKVNFSFERAIEGRYEGIEKAIGVPEFDKFFLKYPPKPGRMRDGEEEEFMMVVEDIKENTRVLARRQVKKIQWLREVMGWEMRRLDATEVVRRKVEGRAVAEVEDVWDRDVLKPCMEVVEKFAGVRGGA